MIIADVADVQKNFEHYLQAVQNGDEVVITENGNEIARIVSRDSSVSFLTDSLTGILKNDYDEKAIDL